MLSKQAFNALLKTLEKPRACRLPSLVTTDPHKLPQQLLVGLSNLFFTIYHKMISVNSYVFIADNWKNIYFH